MDPAILWRLRDLPADLRARGWTFLGSESWTGVMLSTGRPWYRAVYCRPFDDCLDANSGTAPIYDRETRQRIVRISTSQDHSDSVEDALQDAIWRMRAADAHRRDVMCGEGQCPAPSGGRRSA